MKKIAILVMAVCCVVGFWKWLAGEGFTKPDMIIQMAFGEPTQQGMPLEIQLTSSMSNNDPPVGDLTFNYVWHEWLICHFEVLDASQQEVEIRYRNIAQLGSQSRMGPGVGVCRVLVKPGESYTIRYRPVEGEPLRYEGAITAPMELKRDVMCPLVRAEDPTKA